MMRMHAMRCDAQVEFPPLAMRKYMILVSCAPDVLAKYVAHMLVLLLFPSSPFFTVAKTGLQC